jgi:hypothetical protein
MVNAVEERLVDWEGTGVYLGSCLVDVFPYKGECWFKRGEAGSAKRKRDVDVDD